MLRSRQNVQGLKTLYTTSVCRQNVLVACRCYATALRGAKLLASLDKSELPPLDEWKPIFKPTGSAAKRFTVRNPDTARRMAEAFVPKGSRGKVIIEGHPGPGQLTRALMALPKDRISRIIVLENHPAFLEFLKPLEQQDSRVVVRDYHPKDWDAYRKIKQEGLLDDVEAIPWEQGVHPRLQFIMQLSSSVHGEQLLSQLLRAIPGGQWLYQYGRMPMNMVLQKRMLDRIRATEGTLQRCKVSVMAQAAAKCEELISHEDLTPFNNHFHPPVSPAASQETEHSPLDARRIGTPVSAVSIIPHAGQLIESGDLDFWDYCARKLFVQKATPLTKSIISLGPNANILLDKLEPQVPVSTLPRQLTIEQWAHIVKVFKNWPFRPTELGIDVFFETNNRNR